jgi:hypothetical protein
MLKRFLTDPILITPPSTDRPKSPPATSTISLFLCERSRIETDAMASALPFLWWLELEFVPLDCVRNTRFRFSLLLLYWLLDSLLSPVICVKPVVSPFGCREPFVFPPRKLSRAPCCRIAIGCTVDASSTMPVPLVSEVRMVPFNCPFSLVGGDCCQVGETPELASLCGRVGAKTAISGAKVEAKSGI